MGTYEQPGIIQPLAAQALAAAGTQIAKAGEVAMANMTKTAIDNFNKNKKIDEANKKKQNAWGKEIGGIKTTKQGSFNENVGGFLNDIGDLLFTVPSNKDLSPREIGVQEARYSKIPDQVSNCNQAVGVQLEKYLEMMKRDPNSIGGMDGLRTDPNWRMIMQDLDKNEGANVSYTYKGERLYLTFTDPESGDPYDFDAEEFTRGSLKTESMLQTVQDISENKVVKGIVNQGIGKGQGGGGWFNKRLKDLQGDDGVITDIAAHRTLDADVTKSIMDSDYSDVINDPQSMEGYWTRLQLDNGVAEKDLEPWMGNVDKESEKFKEQRKNAEKWIPEYIDNNRNKFGMPPKLKEDPIEEVDEGIVWKNTGTKDDPNWIIEQNTGETKSQYEKRTKEAYEKGRSSTADVTADVTDDPDDWKYKEDWIDLGVESMVSDVRDQITKSDIKQISNSSKIADWASSLEKKLGAGTFNIQKVDQPKYKKKIQKAIGELDPNLMEKVKNELVRDKKATTNKNILLYLATFNKDIDKLIK